MISLNRREVLLRVGGLLLVIPASRVLMACGGDIGTNSNSLRFTSTADPADGHTHTVDLSKADISTPPVGGRTLTTSLDLAHTHTVTLTEADFQSIDAGNSVT